MLSSNHIYSTLISNGVSVARLTNVLFRKTCPIALRPINGPSIDHFSSWAAVCGISGAEEQLTHMYYLTGGLAYSYRNQGQVQLTIKQSIVRYIPRDKKPTRILTERLQFLMMNQE